MKKYYLIGHVISIRNSEFKDLKYLNCIKWAYACESFSTTWSYSSAPGYSGHPRNSSAITHPNDHMSMASQNGNPSMISGALQIKYGYWIFSSGKKRHFKIQCQNHPLFENTNHFIKTITSQPTLFFVYITCSKNSVALKCYLSVCFPCTWK